MMMPNFPASRWLGIRQANLKLVTSVNFQMSSLRSSPTAHILLNAVGALQCPDIADNVLDVGLCQTLNGRHVAERPMVALHTV